MVSIRKSDAFCNPNLVLLREYFRAVYSRCSPNDGMVCLMRQPPSQRGRKFDFVPPENMDQLCSLAGIHARRENVYNTVNLIQPGAVARLRRSKRRGCKEHLQSAVAIVADIDAGPNPKHRYPPQTKILTALSGMPLQPSLVYRSGRLDGGVHAYWLFQQPERVDTLESRDRVEGISRRWLSHFLECLRIVGLKQVE